MTTVKPLDKWLKKDMITHIQALANRNQSLAIDLANSRNNNRAFSKEAAELRLITEKQLEDITSLMESVTRLTTTLDGLQKTHQDRKKVHNALEQRFFALLDVVIGNNLATRDPNSTDWTTIIRQGK